MQMDLDLRSDNKLELGWKETGRTVKRLSQHEMDNKATNFERGFPRRIPTMDRFEMVTSAHEKLLEHEAEEARAAEEEKRPLTAALELAFRRGVRGQPRLPIQDMRRGWRPSPS